MHILPKYLRVILTLYRDIHYSFAVVIALNSIYDDFKTKTSNFFKTGNKIINKTQQILYAVEVKDFRK